LEKPSKTIPKGPWSGKFPDGLFCAIQQMGNYQFVTRNDANKPKMD
jgi:hypothetical protein